jgi:hypothetical protein
LKSKPATDADAARLERSLRRAEVRLKVAHRRRPGDPRRPSPPQS